MVGAYTKGSSGQGEAAMLFGLVAGTMLSVLWYMAAPPKSRRGLVANVAATMFGVVYVPFLVSFALLLLAQEGAIGRNLLLTVVGLTVLYDVTAYAIGTLWGNRPLAPSVSPRKSWEGAIGATFVVLFVALAIVPAFDPFTAARAAGLALVISVAAPLGDLAESAIKRDLGVKDMGSLLPGHGGVLDRIDAILFAAPAAYYFLRLVG
jgi:phosphatidate cytidylyltransferase